MFITELQANVNMLQLSGYGKQAAYPMSMPTDQQGFSSAEQCTVDPRKSRINYEVLGPAITAVNDSRTHSEREVEIAGGWEAPRMALNIVTEIYRTANQKRSEVIMGYTEAYEHIEGGVVPDDLKIYFNRTYVLSSTRVDTPAGESWISEIHRDWAIINGCKPDGSRADTNLMMIRPADIFSQLGTPAPFGQLIQQGQALDMRSRFSNNGIAMTQQRHTAASYYLTDAVQAYLESMHDNMFEESLEDMFNDCRGRVVDPLSNSSPFLEMVIRDTDYRVCGFVTWGELKRIFEGRLEVSTFQMREEPDFGIPGYDNTWESMVANRLVQLLQGLFQDYGYGAMSFQYINGEIRFSNAARTFRSDNDREVFDEFAERLRNEINMLSREELIVEVEYNQQTQAVIQISKYLKDAEPVRFVIPTFCSNLMTPLLTTEVGVMHDNMQFLDFMVRTICDPNVGTLERR